MNMQSQKDLVQASMDWEQCRKMWLLTVLLKLTAAIILAALALVVSLF